MRCGRCGNENEAANRFCGMCGTALVANSPAGGQAPVPGQTGPGGAAVGASSGRSIGAGEERRPAAVSASDARSDAWPSSRPVISGGPSLLGLNVPSADSDSGRAGGGRDSLRPSSNVDYLLEDEEELHRSRGKLILVVAALALAAGFGYLHWKQGGFDWLNGGDKKPVATTTQPSNAAAGADSTAATAGGVAPAAGGAASPGESAAPQTGPAQTSSQAIPSQTPAETAAPQSADQSNTAQSNTGQPSAAQGEADNSSAPAGPESQAESSDSEKQSAPAEANPRQKAHKPSAAKPAAAKPAAAKPVDSVIEAERYIYGRGVGQDCDHGLRLLKPAAQSNVKAMISLGALYSTGTCTPRDLPTAYRWFAMALHKEPDNQALQDDLQKLWSQMTQPERQLAIKLSQ